MRALSWVLTVVAIVTIASAAPAATQVMFTLGDSITFGEGSNQLGSAPNTPRYESFADTHFQGTNKNYSSAYSSTYWSSRGYRSYLQQRMAATGVSYDFIGNRGSGQTGMDTNHWANPGGNLYTSRISGRYDRPVTSINDALLNLTRDTFDINGTTYDISDKTHGQVAFDPAASLPKRILMHGGTNDINGNDPIQAIGGFNRVYRTLYQMYNDNTFADKPLFFIAKIIPKKDNLAGTAVFNQHIEDIVGRWSGSKKNQAKRDFASRTRLVDMADIAIASLDLQWLSEEFGHTQDDLDTMLDLDDDGVVDWFDGNAINTNILTGDGIHPGELGHAVMANVWSNTMPVIASRYAYQRSLTAPTSLAMNEAFSFTSFQVNAIPEPTSLGLWAAASVLLVCRRRPARRN